MTFLHTLRGAITADGYRRGNLQSVYVQRADTNMLVS